MLTLSGTGRGFRTIFDDLTAAMLEDALIVHPDRWQGMDVSKRLDMRSYELLNVVVEHDLEEVEDFTIHAEDVEPNLPWADDHFLERVGGQPLNPGVQWANWPWAGSADRFRDKDKIFNHTYPERLWPKFARTTPGGRFEDGSKLPEDGDHRPRRGIGWMYGDLDDLVGLLVRDPLTRQAYIPLFFPEDTGYGDGGRKPCTLGYQLICREQKLHMYYPMRSCDLVRHFRDDVYLAIRLLLWTLDRCREADPDWRNVVPGKLVMHMTSLHIFENDMIKLRKTGSLR